MSYTVLAVKWRPRRFADLVGQPHVVQALVNSLTAGRLHHAYLFAGTRGVGKTTVARILAKAMNCAQGVVSEPCGVCEACVAIDEGRFVDLIEVDAASRTRVDDTRELLDNVQYAPARGRFKVYLIDEVHMLSNHSFNALLKTLEEPPPHAKFLFATTDPQKLPVTVLSRCLQFNLKRLAVGQIRDQLAHICKEEGVEADEDSLIALARAADGSMRDALSLVDQAIAFGAGALESALVTAMLGSIDRSHVVRLVERLAEGDGAGLLEVVEELDERAADYGSVLDELMGQLQRLAVLQLVGEQAGRDDPPEVRKLATRLSAEDVQLYYQIALQGRRDLPVCRDARMGFEMTLLRMLAFRPWSEESDHSQPSREAAPQQPPRSTSVSSPRPLPKGNAGERTQPPDKGHEDWEALLRAADVRGPARRLADHCALKGRAGDRFELVLSPAGGSYDTQTVRTRLQVALSEHLGRSVTVSITRGELPGPTPAQVREAGENQRMRAAREAIEQDPNVKAMQAEFDAILESDSIEPIDEKERG